MGKVRVYELAKELEIKSKQLIEILQNLGADVKNHMSTLDDDVADLVREHFAQAKDKKQKKQKVAEPKEQAAAEETKEAGDGARQGAGN